MNLVVDSGASTSILPLHMAKDHPLDTTNPPKTYTSASKSEVRTTGEKSVICGFQNGQKLRTTWVIADVHRPLCSVSRMVKHGYHVWFAPEKEGGSGFWNASTNATMKIYEQGGVFLLPAWFQPPSAGPKPGFPGQGPP